ncbi:hypothetical protein ADK67_14955 [Saccharothrix sp. NRRL B-16348]|uniref:hypothetical protein n=1 Tax=Saccharothrix sp. NRRL B-16348 TaxID=1415542 RepID=UPI0006AE1785|nr:hypothetical protein [Saccharothrix sp. NRRL B-16348]KOX27108.1 hypothetical protein ADK67_14955 [Saccharothrix sp. NRRL B-16348]
MWELVVWVLGGPVVALAGLVARLRWQAVRDRRRQETLQVWAERLPLGSEVEIDDLRDDGSRLRFRVVPAASSRGRRR